ncbi:hypothetical protein D3C71_1197570 [compost metagenome]
MPTINDFRTNSGDFAEEQPATEQDAAASEEVIEDDQLLEDELPVSEEADDQQEIEEEDLPELTEREQTAFNKRLERERRKLEESLNQEMETKYAGHKRVVERLGGDPEQIERALQERQFANEVNARAQQMADYYGWDDEQIQQYSQQQVQQRQQQVQQAELQQELQELRISNQVNDLRDNPEFTGISSMKKEIADIVSRSNGTLDVQQAYWALGGQKRAQQTKREVEQREAVKRRTRVVANDSPAAASTEKAIPNDILRQGKQMGMSEKEIRDLMDFDSTNINDFRANKKKRGG